MTSPSYGDCMMQHWRFALVLALSVAFAACGTEASPPADEGAQSADSSATASITVPPVTTVAPATSVSAATTSMHDEEAMHDEMDEMHDEEMTDTAGMEADRDVEIVMTEFAFEPATIEVSPGETVRFIAHNEGAIEHELRFTNEHAAQEHIEAGHADHGDEAEGHHEEMLLTVAAGETGEIVVTFADGGEFDIAACLLPGHYEAGMVAPITMN